MNKYDLETGALAVKLLAARKGYSSYINEQLAEEIAQDVIQAVDKNRLYHENSTKSSL